MACRSPVVGRLRNIRYLEGQERDCPVPEEKGNLGPLARWLQVRDGLEIAIRMLPRTERACGARLQEAWARAAAMVETYEAMECPAWVLPI
jgi:hypothetical protein